MNPSHLCFIFHFASCAFMSGLIWTIQVLHYPAFSQVQESNFAEFHRLHSKNITFIVGPVMCLELFTGAFLVFKNQDSVLLILNFVCLLAIWLSTFFLSVPLHNELGKKQNLDLIRKLVLTNWPRTVLWTFRLVTLMLVFERSNS